MVKQSKRQQSLSDVVADTDGDGDNADGEFPLPSAAGKRQRQRPDDGWPPLQQQPRERRESSAAAIDQRPLAPNLPTPHAAQQLRERPPLAPTQPTPPAQQLRDQRPLAPNLPTSPAQQLRSLRMLELCSGAGGLSFMEHLSDLPAGGAEIRSTWAVDYCPSAAASCKINHPDAHVCGGMGVR